MDRKRSSLLQKIMEYDFTKIELNLFLDTHPDDERAIRLFQEASRELDKLVEEYEREYGPLTASTRDPKHWEWIDDPWPWERNFN